MQETKRSTKNKREDITTLTEEQVKVLQQFGRIRLQDIDKFTKYLPEDPSQPAFKWVVNKTMNPIFVDDLLIGKGDNERPIEFGGKELIYLPRFFNAQMINSSGGLRDMIVIGDLVAVEDPTKIEIKEEKPPIETLPKGVYDAKQVIGESPYIKKLKEVKKKERDYNKSLLPEEE